MRVLKHQFQPNRATGVSPERFVSLMGSVASKAAYVKEFTIVRGNDRGPYINAFFSLQAKYLPTLWSLLQQRVLKHRAIGSAVRRSSIIVCQGTRGWDNYLLLHHFQKAIDFDRLPDV
jgi:hypothetical protein